MVSDKKIFSYFLIEDYVKHVTIMAGQFWPHGHNLCKLGRCLLYDATYQVSRFYALWFRQKDFTFIPYINICKACDPQVMHNLNELARGLLDDATY